MAGTLLSDCNHGRSNSEVTLTDDVVRNGYLGNTEGPSDDRTRYQCESMVMMHAMLSRESMRCAPGGQPAPQAYYALRTGQSWAVLLSSVAISRLLLTLHFQPAYPSQFPVNNKPVVYGHHLHRYSIVSLPLNYELYRFVILLRQYPKPWIPSVEY